MTKMRKTFAAILMAVLAISSIGLAASFAKADISMGNMNVANMNVANTDTTIQRSWVHLTGKITQWGSTPVNGTISVQARELKVNDTVARAMVVASAVWNNGTAKPTGNFTYTYYAAKLANPQMAKLNYEGNNFYLNGTWALYTVTVTNTVITNDGVTSWHRDVNAVTTKAAGQLNVTDNWTKFTLTINGIDQLSGLVRRVLTRTVQINACKVAEDGANKVTVQDLLMVARAYGAMPGMNNYDQKLDFNLHFKIDVTNLATVAANVGQ
jgi:hypothetical protein